MENRRENRSRALWILWAGACVLLGISVYYYPLFALSLLVLPAAWAALALYAHPALLLGCGGVVLLYGLCLGFGLQNSLCVLLLAAPAGALLWLLQRNRFGNFQSVVYVAVVLAFGLFCVCCVPDLLQDGDPYASLRAYFADLPAAFAGTVLEQTASSVLSRLGDYVPAMLYVFAAFYALVNVLLLQRVGTALKLDLCPLSPFGTWSVPYGYALGTGLLSVAAALLSFVKDTGYTQSLSLLIYEMWALPLMLGGLNFLYAVLCRRRGRKIRLSAYMLLMGLAMGLLSQVAQMGLLLLGFAGVVLRHRAGKEQKG